MENRTAVSGVLLLAAAWLVPYTALAGGEEEAVVRVVSEWDSDCSGSTLSAIDDMAKAWYDAVTNSGDHGSAAWQEDGFYHNGNIRDSDFVDENEVSWGKDDENDRPDDIDAMVIAMHGGEYGDDDRWFARVRVNESGSGNCDARQGDMRFGNNCDCEFLHLISCYSMDKENWWPEWSDSFDHLHQIDGFHGITWAGQSLTDEYEDFANDAFDVSIADSWIDNLYKKNISNSHDNCPIPRGVGSTEDDLWDRMDNERYDNVFSDPPGRGSDRWHGVYYIDGCDPKGKGEL